MKLRQKLAMVLAAAMVVTAVPVTTMAYSINTVHGVRSAVENTVIEHEDGLRLVLDFEDSLDTSKGVFYLNFEDFEVDAELYANESIGYDNLIDALKSAVAGAVQAEGNVNALARTTQEGAIAPGVVAADVTLDIDYLDADLNDTVKVKVDSFDVSENKYVETTVEVSISELAKKYPGVNVAYNNLQDAFSMVQQDEFYVSSNGIVDPSMRTNFGGTAKVEILSKDQMRVTMTAVGNPSNNDTKIAIPIMGKVKKGTPVVHVDSLDSASSASNGTYFLTRENIEDDKAIGFEVKEASKITVDGGKLGSFIVTERVEDAITGEETITLELDNSSDLVFTNKQDIELVGKNAFAPNEITLTSSQYDVKEDGKVLEITLPDGSKVSSTTGQWIVSGVEVEPEDVRDEARIGEVEVEVKGTKTKEETVVMAEVVDFDLAVKAGDPVELVAGRGSKEVAVTITESVEESLDDKRWAIFELPENAYIKAEEKDDAKDASDYLSVKVNGDSVTIDENVEMIEDKDGNIKGFKVDFDYKNDNDDNDDDKGYLDPSKANTMEIKFHMFATTEFTGEVKMSVESRIDELNADLHVANVTAPIEVKFESTTVKTGLQDQAFGDITIKETAEDMLEKGVLYVEVEDVEFEMHEDDIEIVTPEGSTLEVEVKDVEDNFIELEVTRQSKEASEFTIKGLVGTVDRTVAEGGLEAHVYGDSIMEMDSYFFEDNRNDKDEETKWAPAEELWKSGDEEHRIVSDDYLVVGTKNTEDIQDANKATTAVFSVGSKEFTVNGETVTMDAAPYIDAEAEKMMVPVRYLAKALGISEQNIMFSNGATTIIGNNGVVVQVTNGSDVMKVNGADVQLAAAVAISDAEGVARTYAPISEIGAALGTSSSFDNATKTATFVSK